jgi:ParB family chromosome partitioning protein
LSAGLSVRDVERAAKPADRKPAKSRKSKKQSSINSEWMQLEEGMSTYFSSPVKLQKGEVGGKITIDFYSDDDLMRILDILGIQL